MTVVQSFNRRLDPSVTVIYVNMPEPADWICVAFSYECSGNWMQFTLFDPDGFCRYAHVQGNSPEYAVLHTDPELCGELSVPGPLPAGRWKIECVATLKEPAGSVSVRWRSGNGALPAEVGAEAGADEELLTEAAPRASRRDVWAVREEGWDGAALNRYDWTQCRLHGGQWYRGDLHLHTTRSDGKRTPRQIAAESERLGLDFIAVTDHNVFPVSWPASDTLVIPGAEVTTNWGDWNALGLRMRLNALPTSEDGGIATPAGNIRIMEEAKAAGMLCVLNHSMAGAYGWMLEDTPLALVDGMEVLNARSHYYAPDSTEKALLVWNALWNDGYRITGVGGSDFHHVLSEPGRADHAWQIGNPSTYVYSERLSAEAILEGVRRGAVYVTRGPRLDVEYFVSEIGRAPGDYSGSDRQGRLPGAGLGEIGDEGLRLRCRIRVEGLSGGDIYVVENGRTRMVHRLSDGSVWEEQLERRRGEYFWHRFEIRADGELIAFTNPVYGGNRERQLRTWGELLRQAGF